MKKILLIDVDSKIPNIALMKLSTYWKSKGYEIELKKLNFNYYPKKRKVILVNGSEFEKVYVAIVFPINKDYVKVSNSEVIWGGVGYKISSKLPDEVEHLELDYSIYPENDSSYGFLTRGCIRNCKFCIVREKEGFIHQVATPKDIIRHKKVVFMDNNILSFQGHKALLKELVDLKIRCQLNQGLDMRLLDDENANLLSKLNYIGEYIFAFDNIDDEERINTKLKLFKKYVKKDWKAKFYIYCHPDMDIQKDVLYRINWCKENKVLPYLMRDQSCWDSINRDFYIDLCAYCNQPAMFKKITFQEFMPKRMNNTERIKKSIALYSVNN